MNRLGCFLAGIMFVSLVSRVSAQTAADLADRVVVAYGLSAVEEATFSATDGALSPFWAQWEGRNNGGLQLDYIDLTVDNNGWNVSGSPFSGSDDARMVIQAAWGAAGLYLCHIVTDNNFVEAAGFQSDGVDLMLDNLSSADIAAGLSFEMYVQPSWWTVTYTCKQWQVNMGGASLPTSFAYNYYDPGAYAYTFNAAVSIESAPVLYNGMAFDFVRISETQKAQEWFVPWAEVGVGGVAGIPAAGTRFAFTGGYNDQDPDDGTGENDLRWIDRTDPWQAPCETAGEVAGKCDAWGDIEIAGTGLSGEAGARHNGAAFFQSRKGPGPVSCFSLDGRTAEPGGAARRGTYVRRLSDGRAALELTAR